MVRNFSNGLKFSPDMYFYGIYQIPEAFWKISKIGNFRHTRYCTFAIASLLKYSLDIKWPKMLQMSWFMDQKCISMGFIKFWKKNFEKFRKLADFWPKNDHFACIALRFFGTRFSTENVSSLWKMLLSPPNLVYICPKVSSTIFCGQNFDFLSSNWKN